VVEEKPYIGCVWPFHVYFPDFNKPIVQEYWNEGIHNMTAKYNVSITGIWTDMNEFAQFVPGEWNMSQECPIPSNEEKKPIYPIDFGTKN